MEDDNIMEEFDSIFEEVAHPKAKQKPKISSEETKKLKKTLKDMDKLLTKYKNENKLLKDFKDEQDSLNEESIDIIKKINFENECLKKDLEVYSTSFLNEHKKDYKIYVLDPYHKKELIDDMDKLLKSTENDTIKNILYEIIEMVNNESIPELVILSENTYDDVIEYFLDIDQNQNECRLIINKKLKIEFYISETIGNKIKVI